MHSFCFECWPCCPHKLFSYFLLLRISKYDASLVRDPLFKYKAATLLLCAENVKCGIIIINRIHNFDHDFTKLKHKSRNKILL